MVYASVYPSLYATEAMGEIECKSFDDFLAYMREVWRTNTNSKADNLPFIPSQMDGTGRGAANVVSTRLLVLDNDGGDLTRDEFARLFPKTRMVFVNSASSRPEAERWRVFIPLDLAVDADIYKLMVARILKRLNHAGYWSKHQLRDNPRIKSKLCHGFDDAKRVAASIFNLPSQAEAGPEASFFDDISEGRAMLDVRGWFRKAIRPSLPPETPSFDHLTEADIEAIKMEIAAFDPDALIKDEVKAPKADDRVEDEVHDGPPRMQPIRSRAEALATLRAMVARNNSAPP
jgi:hypothetical protein